MLKCKGLSTREIAYAVGISERLTQEYLDLYQRYDTPDYRDRLTEVIQMVSNGGQAPASGAKKGAK
jgi:hypothetical protein